MTETTMPTWVVLDADAWVENHRSAGKTYSKVRIVKVNRKSVDVVNPRDGVPQPERFHLDGRGALKAGQSTWGGLTLYPADHAPAHAYVAERARQDGARAAEVAVEKWRDRPDADTHRAAGAALARLLGANFPGVRDDLAAARLRHIAASLPVDHNDRPALFRAAEILAMLDDLRG